MDIDFSALFAGTHLHAVCVCVRERERGMKRLLGYMCELHFLMCLVECETRVLIPFVTAHKF